MSSELDWMSHMMSGESDSEMCHSRVSEDPSERDTIRSSRSRRHSKRSHASKIVSFSHLRRERGRHLSVFRSHGSSISLAGISLVTVLVVLVSSFSQIEISSQIKHSMLSQHFQKMPWCGSILVISPRKEMSQKMEVYFSRFSRHL